MDKRKEKILHTIIKEHVRTGVPVGSSVLVRKYKLNISSATVRNEMASLEEDGLIIQPHTSAGRIPTEQAYNLYLENLSEKKLNQDEMDIFKKTLAKDSKENFKQAAKELARLSGMAVFWAYHKNNLFYTGISNLLSQPEFTHSNLIYDISAIIDRVDEIIAEIYDNIKYEPQVLIGSENPFGDFCSTILTKYKAGDDIGMFGIIGPIRMDYERNIALVKFINKVISYKR